MVCRCKRDYDCQLYSTASPARLKNLNSIHRKGIRIYTGVFRTSPVESLHAEAFDPPLELRMNELGLRFLYRPRSKTTYIESLNTLDDREDQNYEENEGATKPTEVHLRKLEQG